MTRKTLIITVSIIFLLVIAGLVGGYFYLTNTKTTDSTGASGTGSLSGGGVASNASSTIQASSTPGVIPRLRQITQTPVAGYDFVDTATSSVIWYVDRATGNVFQTATNTLDVTRITNTTIPKAYEAYIGKGGASVVLRMLNESTDAIQTFIGSPKKKVATSTDNVKDLVGTFVGDTITFGSMAPTKDKFFGITSGGLGNIYQLSGKSTNIFSSPLKRWVPQWVNDSTILLTSSPSARTQNIAYYLNPVTKAFTKLLGPKNGLVASASPDALHVLFSENKNDTLSFGLFDVKTGAETSISNETIPDKCTWSKKTPSLAYCAFPKDIPSGLYPDDWYKGKVFFNDTLGSIDTKTLQTNSYDDFEKISGIQIDATNLVLSKDETYILFTNKRDLTLWALQL